MPSRQPFTKLCQLAARGRHGGRADLHLHTTHSDGTYSPAEVVELARRSGLAALAVTDHDTLGAIPAARVAAGADPEVVPGVEISTEFRGRELHLLAYFVDIADPALNDALTWIRQQRGERFQEMVERLRQAGIVLGDTDLQPEVIPDAIGRRHLAELLVRDRKAGSVREAFARYLHDGSRFVVPKKRLPVAEAIALARGAGGVTAWAHPSAQCDRQSLLELHASGLGAVEVDYPDVRGSRQQQLRGWAAELGLGVTGGSDCHGPGKREIGSCTVSAEELVKLRRLAGEPHP
jgi:3',5'-nucleoside bisphosphate phosphatase